MALDWGWDAVLKSGKDQTQSGEAFFNPTTGQNEAAMSGGGVGNPYATAPTANYADPKWTLDEQKGYSMAMTQGNNALAKQIGDAAWKNYDTRRAQNAVGSGRGQAATTPDAGKYTNAEYDYHTGQWHVYDGKNWSTTDTKTLLANRSDALQKAHDDWWWNDQVAKGYLSGASDVNAQAKAENTKYNYGNASEF
jgi:hypothetical protein